MARSHVLPIAPCKEPDSGVLRSALAHGRGVLSGLLMLLGAVALHLNAGCASSEHAERATADPLANVPADFQLDIQVLVGRSVESDDRLERREVHMVILPDGSLHAAQGKEVTSGSRPGLARILYRGQVADVWNLLNQLSVIGTGEPPTGPVDEPNADEIVYVVEYTMNNDRRRIEKRVSADDAKSGAETVLVRSIGALAWLRDVPISDSTVAPLRYDFGRDPWARYRSVDSAQ